MNDYVNCPNCRFRGRLSDALATLRTIVCPRCKAAVTTDQLRRGMSAKSLDDASFPIFVEPSADHTPLPEGAAITMQAPPAPAGLGDRVAAVLASVPVAAVLPAPVAEPEPVDRTPVPVAKLAPIAAPVAPAAPAPAEPVPPVAAPAPVTPPAPAAVAAVEPEPYTGDYMKEEAGRFAHYVAARLGDLQKKRAQLAEAESRFEQMTMNQKQELYRARVAVAADAARVKDREAALQAQAEALAAREAEVAAREARAARAGSRATDADRRMADLRATIDQLEARRLALAEERDALNRRAEALDRAELAQHRRAAELDELDERLRLEQEEFERERTN